MKLYDFDKYVERRGSGSIKWDKQFDTEKGKQIIPLWVADMDFPCSDEIQSALFEQVGQQIYGYSCGMDDAYRKSVCRWFERRFEWEIDPSTIFYSPGVVPAIGYLLACVCREGDGVIIQTPVYYPFKERIEACGRVVVENPLINKNGVYTMDFKDLEKKMARADVKGMILCSPHNPVGRVWRREELLQVRDIAYKYKKWIISDEIHCDLIRKEHRHIPMHLIAPDYKDNVLVCTAPSKSFNLAGLQNSNIIITKPKYQKRWELYVQKRLRLSSGNNFALAATKAAYNSSESWLDQVNAYIDENVAFAVEYLRKYLPKAVISPCEGTYLLWVDVRKYCRDKEELERRMLKEGVILDEGYLFGENGAGFERINLACSRAVLKEGLKRMATALRVRPKMEKMHEAAVKKEQAEKEQS